MPNNWYLCTRKISIFTTIPSERVRLYRCGHDFRRNEYPSELSIGTHVVGLGVEQYYEIVRSKSPKYLRRGEDLKRKKKCFFSFPTYLLVVGGRRLRSAVVGARADGSTDCNWISRDTQEILFGRSCAICRSVAVGTSTTDYTGTIYGAYG